MELLFEALSKIVMDWTLTIAGSGEKVYVQSLKQKAESLKIDHKINWIGQVKNVDKFNLLAEHNLMVLTFHNENFANVVIESLSMGTPVLISEKVGLADYVLHKKLGWVTALNVEAIRLELTKACEDFAHRNQIREHAPSIIAQDFNPKHLIQDYIKLYQSIKLDQ